MFLKRMLFIIVVSLVLNVMREGFKDRIFKIVLGSVIDFLLILFWIVSIILGVEKCFKILMFFFWVIFLVIEGDGLLERIFGFWMFGKLFSFFLCVFFLILLVCFKNIIMYILLFDLKGC